MLSEGPDTHFLERQLVKNKQYFERKYVAMTSIVVCMALYELMTYFEARNLSPTISGIVAQILDKYTTDMKLVEGFAHSIKVLASQSGLEEIKVLAFKAELATMRANMEEVVSYAKRIRQIIETYRKTNILP